LDGIQGTTTDKDTKVVYINLVDLLSGVSDVAQNSNLTIICGDQL